jgi:hypothetical protein
MKPTTCDACDGTRIELRQRKIANGSIQYVYQCLSCGRAASNPLRRSKVENPERLLAWDGNIAKRDEVARKAASEIEKATWFAEHDVYFKTAKWQKKREVVLKKAKGICEGCGERKATQVHHLSYDHWKHEMLWELVAICGDCHEMVHADRRTLLIRVEASKDERS